MHDDAPDGDGFLDTFEQMLISTLAPVLGDLVVMDHLRAREIAGALTFSEATGAKLHAAHLHQLHPPPHPPMGEIASNKLNALLRRATTIPALLERSDQPSRRPPPAKGPTTPAKPGVLRGDVTPIDTAPRDGRQGLCVPRLDIAWVEIGE